MQVHITARHIKLTSALSDYIQKKLERVARHFEAVIRAQVVLSIEKHRHIAEVVAHANGHHDFRAVCVSGDLYAAVDLVAEKLHKHMARQKDKRVRGRRSAKSLRMKEPSPPLPDPAAAAEGGPLVTRVSRFVPQRLSLADAAGELERQGFGFLLFLNDDGLNVLYKRPDKSYGLLEPELQP